MLSSLHIENVAVLRSVDVELQEGFSAFTGETGAGKSMIIDSIHLLLGDRADRDMIRRGEERALVSAVFTDLTPAEHTALAGAGLEPDEDGALMIQRTLTVDGRSAVRVNGRTVTLSVLRQIAPALINIHGQNDTHTLIDPENHIRILDSYAHAEQEVADYTALWQELCEIRHRIRTMTVDEGERLRTVEMLRYQLADIDALALKPGEEEQLEEKRARLRNAERITRQTSFAYRAMKGSEKGSVTYLLSRTVQSLRQIQDVIPSAEALAARLEEYLWQIDDIAEQIYDMQGEEEGDPTELLDRVETRLDAIGRLVRKYGGTVEDVLAYRAKAEEQLQHWEGAEQQMDQCLQQEQDCLRRMAIAAASLRERRIHAAEELTRGVTEALTFLDMPRVRFEIRVSPQQENGQPLYDRHGSDRIAFLISTNPGETPGPLAKIASGGELSRIMLALKSVIADRDGIPTVIYDEVDTGVSGKTARKIGIKLRDSAARTQVLAVTHSAQIASLGHAHYVIEKQERDGRAETAVHRLDPAARVEELARILGGLEVTDAQRQAARDMLQEQ